MLIDGHLAPQLAKSEAANSNSAPTPTYSSLTQDDSSPTAIYSPRTHDVSARAQFKRSQLRLAFKIRYLTLLLFDLSAFSDSFRTIHAE